MPKEESISEIYVLSPHVEKTIKAQLVASFLKIPGCPRGVAHEIADVSCLAYNRGITAMIETCEVTPDFAVTKSALEIAVQIMIEQCQSLLEASRDFNKANADSIVVGEVELKAPH